MSELVKRATYAVSQELKASDLRIGRSHLAEIHAALLGYGTYAALTREALDPSVEFTLDRAQVIVLDLAAGAARAAALLPGLSQEQVAGAVMACASSVRQCSNPIAVFSSVDEMFRQWASAEIAATALEAPDLDPALSRVLGQPKVGDGWEVSGPMWASRHEWVVEAQGTMQEPSSGDGDDLYGDVVVDWRGRLVFHKAGRAGLIVATRGATCQVRR